MPTLGSISMVCSQVTATHRNTQPAHSSQPIYRRAIVGPHMQLSPARGPWGAALGPADDRPMVTLREQRVTTVGYLNAGGAERRSARTLSRRPRGTTGSESSVSL